MKGAGTTAPSPSLPSLAAIPALRAGIISAPGANMGVELSPQQFHLLLAILAQAAYFERRNDAFLSLHIAAYWHVRHAEKPLPSLAGTIAAALQEALDQWPAQQQS